MLQVGVFAAATAGSLILLQLLSYRRTRAGERLRARMSEEFGHQAETGANLLYKNLGAMDLNGTGGGATGAGTEGGAAVAQPKLSWRQRFNGLLEQGGIGLTVGQFLCMVLASGGVPAVIAIWAKGWVIGGSIGVVGFMAPFLFLHFRRSVRRERYLKQLTGAFELMARVIRAGRSVPQAFQAVSETYEGALASDFAHCQHQMDLGLRPEMALKDLAQRSGILEMRVFVIAITLQRQTGGNLSDVLDRLAVLVRARLRLRQQVRSLTAEGRLQSLTLVVLPFLTFAVMYFVNRQYAEILLAHGRLLLATVALIVVGVLWIRRIVNFEV